MTNKALKENKRRITEHNPESDEKPTALVEQIMAEVSTEIEDDPEYDSATHKERGSRRVRERSKEKDEAASRRRKYSWYWRKC
jgi:hypothetical protein